MEYEEMTEAYSTSEELHAGISVSCYVRKCSFLGPEFTKIAFGDRALPGPTGGAYSGPQT